MSKIQSVAEMREYSIFMLRENTKNTSIFILFYLIFKYVMYEWRYKKCMSATVEVFIKKKKINLIIIYTKILEIYWTGILEV